MPQQPFADDKDWTWVLREPCAECRFDVRQFPRENLPGMIRSNAAEWVGALGGDDGELRQRPQPDRWSALEYACHVRDVFALYDRRLELMLTEDGPHFLNWNQDETALQKDYPSSSASVVATEIQDGARRLAARFETLTDDDWRRTGYRSDGAAFTVETFGRYFIHDPEHHLHDIRTGFAQLRP